MAGRDHSTATRRQLLSAGLGVGAVAAMTGVLDPSAAEARHETDADALRVVLEVEQVVAYSYLQLSSAAVLSARAGRPVTEFLRHEQEHVQLLDAELRARGASTVEAPLSVAAADKALAKLRVSKQLSTVKTERDALILLVDAESAVTGAYYVAMSKLADARLVRTAAEAMSAEAQHYTVLRRLLHSYPVGRYVPGAFVEGRH